MAKRIEKNTMNSNNTSDISTNIFRKSIKVLKGSNVQFIKSEMIAAISTINKSSSKIGKILLSVEISNSFVKMNYNSMREWMITNFPESYDALNRHLVAARIAYNIEGYDGIGKYSNNSLEPMNKLTPKQQKEVFNKIKKEMGDEFSPATFTKQIVSKAIIELGYANSTMDGEDKPKGKKKLEQSFNKLGKDINDPDILSELLLSAFDHEVLDKAMKMVSKKLREELANGK